MAGHGVGWADPGALKAGGWPVRHAFLWHDGEMRDLGALEGPLGDSRAFAVNSSGHVVGWSSVGSVVHAVLWLPEPAFGLAVDEKILMQALDRTQPGLPLKKGRGGTMTHDYKRNGTTSLFAALHVRDGSVIGTCMNKHRHQEWVKFLNLIKRRVPEDKEIHIICDNYSTHTHQKVKAWFERHPRVHCHYPPTSASWLNMVKRFFRDLSERRLTRGVFESVEALQRAVKEYIAHNNQNPSPFIWTAKASDIPTKVARARRKLEKLQSA